MENIVDKLEEIISPIYQKQMNIFRIDPNRNVLDIEPAILQALSKGISIFLKPFVVYDTNAYIFTQKKTWVLGWVGLEN